MLFAPNIDKLAAKQNVTALIDALENKNPDTRARAAVALGHLRDERAFEPLKALFTGDHVCRIAAIEALGVLGDPRALQPLLHDLAEAYATDEDFLGRAVPSSYGVPQAQPDLSQVELEVRAALLRAIGTVGRAHREQLARELVRGLAIGTAQSGRWAPAPQWLRIIGDLGTFAAELLLSAETREYGYDPRLQIDPGGIDERAIRIGLRSLGSDALEPCLGAMGRTDGVAQARAAVTLGAIGDERAIRPLSEYGDVVSLAELGGAPGFDALTAMLAAGREQAAVVQHLAQCGDPRATDVLISRLSDGDRSVRKAAATQLFAQLSRFQARRAGEVDSAERDSAIRDRLVEQAPRIVADYVRRQRLWLDRVARFGLAQTPRPLVRNWRSNVLDDQYDTPAVLRGPVRGSRPDRPLLASSEVDAVRIIDALLNAEDAIQLSVVGDQRRLSSAGKRHIRAATQHLAELRESIAPRSGPSDKSSVSEGTG